MNEEVSQRQPQRLDRWLWCARFFKTRSLATKFVNDGNIRVTRRSRTFRATKASFAVSEGDMLVFSRAGRLRIVKVLCPAERRGPPREAQILYADESPPPAPKSEKTSDLFSREKGAGRPTKKHRRAIDALKLQ